MKETSSEKGKQALRKDNIVLTNLHRDKVSVVEWQIITLKDVDSSHRVLLLILIHCRKADGKLSYNSFAWEQKTVGKFRWFWNTLSWSSELNCRKIPLISKYSVLVVRTCRINLIYIWKKCSIPLILCYIQLGWQSFRSTFFTVGGCVILPASSPLFTTGFGTDFQRGFEWFFL